MNQSLLLDRSFRLVLATAGRSRLLERLRFLPYRSLERERLGCGGGEGDVRRARRLGERDLEC